MYNFNIIKLLGSNLYYDVKGDKENTKITPKIF